MDELWCRSLIWRGGRIRGVLSLYMQGGRRALTQRTVLEASSSRFADWIRFSIRFRSGF
jgi:hypothetical protein